MKSVALFLFVGVVGLIGLSQATDYCAASLCSKGEKHIGCQNSGEFAKSCPKEKKLIKIDDKLKKLIVSLHNSLRNDIAGGKIKGFEGATRMASISWDDNLAELATMHVKRCEFEHDECHNTVSFKFSGQNLAQNYFSGFEPTPEDTLNELINSWFDEYKEANMDVIKKYPRSWAGEDIGHFTAMAQQKNTKVGCALLFMVNPDGDDMDSNLLTCDYAVTNMINEPVYEAGKTASKCQTGTNPEYKNLCSVKEVYDK